MVHLSSSSTLAVTVDEGVVGDHRGHQPPPPDVLHDVTGLAELPSLAEPGDDDVEGERVRRHAPPQRRPERPLREVHPVGTDEGGEQGVHGEGRRAVARVLDASEKKCIVRGQRLGDPGEREDEHVGDERAGRSGEGAEDGCGRVEAPRGEGVELGAEEGVEAAVGGEAGQEERVEPERERRAEVSSRPPREGDEARERGRRGGAEEKVEDAVRGGRGWRAAARELQHAGEAARREVRQQRGERHRASGWVLIQGSLLVTRGLWMLLSRQPPRGREAARAARLLAVRRRRRRWPEEEWSTAPFNFHLEDLSPTSSPNNLSEFQNYFPKLVSGLLIFHRSLDNIVRKRSFSFSEEFIKFY